MNLNEYIKSRKEDVHAYLKDINYENLERENAAENLSPELDLMFNKTPTYRKETNNFLISIRNAYNHLVDDELEFASSIEEVETAIHEFEIKLTNLIKEFKNNILNIFSEETGYKQNAIDSNLDFINIKIRKRSEKVSTNELHRAGQFYNLKEIFICIYIFVYQIKDKEIKLKNLYALIKVMYEEDSQEYQEAIKIYEKFKLNTMHYDRFIRQYNEQIDKLLPSQVEEAEELDNKPKSRS